MGRVVCCPTSTAYKNNHFFKFVVVPPEAEVYIGMNIHADRHLRH